MTRVLGEVMALSAAALLAYMLALWALSVRLRDVSIVDPAWPAGFVIVAWIAFAIGDGCEGRRALVAALVSLWGARLGAYLLARKHELVLPASAARLEQVVRDDPLPSVAPRPHLGGRDEERPR